MKKFNLKRIICCLLLTGGVLSAKAQYNAVSLVTGAEAGTSGLVNGTGASVRFNQPVGITINANGDFYIADELNHVIRKMTAAGVVTTFAGLVVDGAGVSGYENNTDPLLAKFNRPWDVAVDKNGDVLVADYGNNSFRRIKVNTDGTAGAVTTLAGTGVGGSGAPARAKTPETGGNPTTFTFHQPSAITVDKNGVIYLGESWYGRIRKIDTDGLMYYVTGVSPTGDEHASADGALSVARIGRITKMITDSDGDLYIGERSAGSSPNIVRIAKIRKITFSTGQVSTLAGGDAEGSTDGTGSAARFNQPTGMAIDANKNVYVADFWPHKIRKITPAGVVTTLAGSTDGATNGAIATAKFSRPKGLVIDASGNLYVTETLSSNTGGRIRKIYFDPTLPVNLVSFTGKQQNNGIKLDWATASEQNNSHFEILRSADEVDFKMLNTVSGNNNSDKPLYYSFIDYNPLAGTNYYLLKQVDFNGNSQNSKVLAVNTAITTGSFTAFMKSDGVLEMHITAEKPVKATVYLTDITGKKNQSAELLLAQGQNKKELRLSELPSGIYITTLVYGEEKISTKFIK